MHEVTIYEVRRSDHAKNEIQKYLLEF